MGGFLGFTGKGFAGGWTFPTGSCGENFNRRQLLLPEFGIPAQLQARFPVKFQTLNSLPRGHYFRVRISAGHYARAHRNSCFAQGGCLKDQFSWKGVVTVTRKS